MDTHDRMPVHPVPDEARERAARPALRVDGLVRRPRELTPADLAGLPRRDVEEPFVCEEGWQVPGLRWRGVRLADVLALAGPLPGARYVRVCAGDYAVPLPLVEAEQALLCEALNGEPLAAENGAPWRLLAPGGQCFTSVKWVDRLEATAEPGAPTGEQIARARLQRPTGSSSAG